MARDMLYDRLFRHAMTRSIAFHNWERRFRGLPVYDLTDAMPLLMDVDTTGIPKRLPHLRMWAEWDSDVARTNDGDPYLKVRTGVLVEGVDSLSTGGMALFGPDGEIAAKYNIWTFTKIDKEFIGQGLVPPSRVRPDEPVLIAAIYQAFINEGDTTRLAFGEPSYADSRDEADRLSDRFLQTGHIIVPSQSRGVANFVKTSFSPWWVFKAAAMLNCRNITTDEIHQDKKQPRVKGEREHRPYCSYKVLKLEVPRRWAERNGEAGEGDDGPKQRFHLCRGHFKNLQHPRYKDARGWHWWPACWRGSIELGRADKSYRLTSSTKLQSSDSGG